ncbi:hypothetical protein IscW_ISCW015993 [Ixodes scapularis]|uniref:Uncharacterized protein n=1 Tax=Ixodes scapularis TaxID=6945 RepID=B7P1T5_IXOSC|nr:hypothetical protein IscW_ISCW015993 [Ixodes scapularis]|eukprot:XP_002433492.1 hypothetical protein IscW_ISCW015993 [Ixodes scapularis]
MTGGTARETWQPVGRHNAVQARAPNRCVISGLDLEQAPRSASAFSLERAVLEMNAVAVKLYSIRGVVSKRYLCMNRKGQLSGQEVPNPDASSDASGLCLGENRNPFVANCGIQKRRSEKCIFQLSELPNAYSTFSSMRYSRGTRWRWYLSIGKNGHVKRGRRPRQKGTNFLPRSVKDFRL